MRNGNVESTIIRATYADIPSCKARLIAKGYALNNIEIVKITHNRYDVVGYR